MNRLKNIIGVVFIGTVLLLANTAFADVGYHGMLVSTQLDGTGIWVNDPGNDDDWVSPTIEWGADEQPDRSWQYRYIVNVYQGDVSHFILETSEPLPEGDIFDASGDFVGLDIGQWFDPGPGNPDMPEPIYGVKFDDAWGTTFTVQFNSWRMPVWGDFYAKDGNVGGSVNQLWNAGFLLPDPWDPPRDGSVDDHILRPDARIPEPGTIVLFGLGLLGMGIKARRRNKQ